MEIDGAAWRAVGHHGAPSMAPVPPVWIPRLPVWIPVHRRLSQYDTRAPSMDPSTLSALPVWIPVLPVWIPVH